MEARTNTIEELEPAPLTILLIDDTADSSRQFREDLSGYGYKPDVIQIKSKSTLLTWLQDNPDDSDDLAIVANHRVPGFAALDVIRLLKEAQRDIIVVLLSSPRDNKEKGRLLREGAINWITLQQVAEVIPIIENELRNRKQLREIESRYQKQILAIQIELEHAQTLREKDQNKRDSAIAGLEALKTDSPTPQGSSEQE